MHNSSTQLSHVDASLVKALLRIDAFPHPAEDIELMETHISWVILAGNYAYKIKKPVVLDFLDFGTLEKRRHFCEEELRLNRPWAPELYLDIVAVTGSADEPLMGGDGEALEYAVKMLRFDQDLRLDRQLEAGLLTVTDMKELGQNIAARHASAERPDPADRERIVGQAVHYVRENFDHLGDIIEADDFRFLQDWTERELAKHDATLRQRFDDGFVRDCHGDLHLGNLVRLPSGITTFDCIEFNPDLRNTDVFADVGFLAMDLTEKGHPELAAHFLNRYLERSGDYEGSVLLDLYFIYRCLVRAKVAVIRASERENDNAKTADLAEARDYCDLAARQAAYRKPVLLLMHGFSGSGKTRVSGDLMAALPAIRLRSDVERKRLFGLEESASSESEIGAGIYTDSADDRVYARLFELAARLLDSAHNVILDAAFLDADRRGEALAVAGNAGCTALIVSVSAPDNILRQRLRDRAAARRDASEAGVAVLEHQLANADELSDAERRIAVNCDNSVSPDVNELIKRVNHAATIR